MPYFCLYSWSACIGPLLHVSQSSIHEIMRKWRQSDMLLWVDGLTALLPPDNAVTCIEVDYSISLRSTW